MFGIGVGMLYTPILVDRLQLEYPSGHAVANILRALTDPTLLKRSIGKLGGGIGLARLAWVCGRVASLAADRRRPRPRRGLIVGAARRAGARRWRSRLGASRPTSRASAGSGPTTRSASRLPDRPRDDLGAALVDIALIGSQAVAPQRNRATGPAEPPSEMEARQHRAPLRRGWRSGAWRSSSSATGAQPAAGLRALRARASFLFVLVNGIRIGITDSNPISSAFVISVLLMASLGLQDPVVGLMAASILLGRCSVGCDMQQDRSTGWRLGTNRDDPVPLPGRRHRHGRGAVRRVREALHERLPRARASTRSTTPRPSAGQLAVGDDLQVRRRHPRHGHLPPYR